MKIIKSAVQDLIDATVVEVEASFTKGMPSFTIVGMISTSIKKTKGIQVSLITTSPKNKYATKVVEYFKLGIPLEDIYGYEDLKQFPSVPIKTSTICEIRTKYCLSNDEIIFVGDSQNDFLACSAANISFVSYKDSTASKFFDNKLLHINVSYLELEDIIEDFKNLGFTIFKRNSEYIGDFFTFSNYIKDV